MLIHSSSFIHSRGPPSITPACLSSPAHAVAANLNQPSSITVGPGGALFFTDTANNVVRCLLANGTLALVAGVAESQPLYTTKPTLLNAPSSVAFDHDRGWLFIADTGNNAVGKVRLTPPRF